MTSLIALAFLFLFTSTANATLPYPSLNEDHDPKIYQIGSEWGKTPLTPKVLDQASPVFIRAAQATLKLSTGATAIYLGKFNGLHLIATNHHVCSIGAICLNGSAQFVVLKKSYRVAKFLATMTSVDLTILSIDVPAEDDSLLAPVAHNFAFHHVITQGEPLLTLGFGIAGNASEQLMYSQDDDCRVISQTNELKLLSDPDTLSPADYQAWSFANGCDVSHGDSGSAMLNRETGELIGILWTGRTPKPTSIQDSAHVESLTASPTEEVWSDLTYSVPASKMPEAILDYLKRSPWVKGAEAQALRDLVRE